MAKNYFVLFWVSEQKVIVGMLDVNVYIECNIFNDQLAPLIRHALTQNICERNTVAFIQILILLWWDFSLCSDSSIFCIDNVPHTVLHSPTLFALINEDTGAAGVLHYTAGMVC